MYYTQTYPHIHTRYTFEEVNLLFAMVTRCRNSEGCIHVVWNLLKAHRDVTWVVVIQNIILKAPVLTALLGPNP